MAEIASLSTHTKRFLENRVSQLEQEIEFIDQILKSGRIALPETEIQGRVQIARKYQVIADLQILIDEIPTLEDAVSLAETEAEVQLSDSLIASIH